MSAGANRDDWDTLSILLGLGTELLPVVSDMSVAISPDSTMKDLGKTPSRFNKQGQAVGFPGWSQRITTDADLARWMRDDRLGICIQTREVRAIDVDVPDQEAADTIGRFIYDWLGQVALPRRERSNSGKFLLAFRLPGDLRKRVIKVAGGIIELLATGQQFIAVGTHPSGVRYEWAEGRLPDDFPALDLATLDGLWQALTDQFAIEAPKPERATNVLDPDAAPPAPVDPAQLAAALDAIPNEGADELDYDAWLHIIMALHWETSASHEGLAMAHAFSARSGKYNADEVDLEWGRINSVVAPGKAPVTGRTILHAARSHGWSEVSADDFAIITVDDAGAAPDDPPGYGPLPKFIRKKDGRIVVTMDNMVKALHRPDMTGMHVGYDKFRDELMHSKDGGQNWASFRDADYTVIRIALERRGFEPPSKDATRDAVLLVAHQNAFDSAQLWLSRLGHDGVSRVDTFLPRYFGTDDTPYTRAVSRYLWSAMAGRVMEPGCQADMVPILVGGQGLRKSSAIAAMVPDRDFFAELSFSEKDDDLARKMRGLLLGEIAEMKGLHGRDSEAIKAWITKRYENWTPKFKEFNTRFARRTILIGTANKAALLVDPTGHRRWLPTMVGDFTDVAAVERDREQLWAEGAALFLADGVAWRDAEELAKAEHANYEIHDEWEPIVGAWLESTDDFSEDRPCDRDGLTTHEVLQGALNKDAKNCTRADEMRIATCLRSLGFESRQVRRGGTRPWLFFKGKTGAA